MLRSTASKIAWVGRTASMVFGLALVLALIFGVATTALSATGGNFLLGKLNEAGSQTTLVGTVAKAAQSALVVVNEGTGSALNLRVTNTNSPPMKVNSSAKVANLNADLLDGKDPTDFVSGTSSVTTVDESFSDPDGTGGTKGFSNALNVPGAQIQAACLEQSSGIEMFLNRASDVSTVSLWRDDGGANPTAKTLQSGGFEPTVGDSVPPSAADHVIWHGSSTAGTFTAELFTRYESGGTCHWSGYVLSD